MKSESHRDVALELQIETLRSALDVEHPVSAQSQARFRMAVAEEFAAAPTGADRRWGVTPAMLAPVAVALVAYASTIGAGDVVLLLALGITYGVGASRLLHSTVTQSTEA